MLLSDLKSGMVIEVLNDGITERYILCEISGKLVAFNEKYTLGELDYFFSQDLSTKDTEHDVVELLKVMVIVDTDWNVFTAIHDDTKDALKVIWSK